MVAAAILFTTLLPGCGRRDERGSLDSTPAGAPQQVQAEQPPADAPTQPATVAPAPDQRAEPVPTEGSPGKPASTRPVSPVNLDWPAPTPEDKWTQCPFTQKRHDPNNTLVAVVVENSAKARPQSGLVEADVVYEALAEGGISRFLALFHCSSCKKIGPVRSIRPYFAVIAREWGAPVAHCGGDAKDIEPVRSLGLVDVDELHDGRGFWRDTTREMPHNLYVTANNVRSRARETSASSKVIPVSSPPWVLGRWRDEPAAGVEIVYGPRYTVTYNRVMGGYRRSMNGEVHKDRETGRAILAANIIVQFADSRVAYSDLGLIIDLVGKGKAVFLAEGKYQEGVWEKTSPESPTRFTTSDGETIRCAPGQTWIQVVPSNASVSPIK